MKILLADDSKTSLNVTKSYLRKLGVDLVLAEDGLEAISLLEIEKPDLIILDITMENMDGVLCVKKIREMLNDNWIPIIFLTDSTSDQMIKKGINAGCDDYLIKPFSEIMLAEKIKSMQRIADMRQKISNLSQELATLSSVDILTGLYNRQQFEKTLKEKLSEADRYNSIVTLMFIDLDYFKNINDTLGFNTGNLLLQKIATRLKTNFRLEDFIARLGGDEFAIILTHIENMYTVETIANKIIKTIREPIELDDRNLQITCSIGIAFYPDEGITREMLLQNVGFAMYHAKRKGRNNYQYFSQSLSQNYRDKIAIEEELKYVIERKELQLSYQPIINLSTKYLYGMEAIMFWRHEKYGLLPANEFMPIAEKNGMVAEIEVWLLNSILKQIAKWVKSGHKDFVLSANLLLQHFTEDKMMQIINYYIERYKISGSLLQVELRDISFLNDKNSCDKIKKLSELGVGIALDDFGATNSSLIALKQLPINTIKMDKTLIEAIDLDKKNATILNSLIKLGKDLNLNVIAEGITTKEQYQFLLNNGCQYGQGGFISDVVSEVEISDYLNKKIIAKI